jgi:hypothetical protein
MLYETRRVVLAAIGALELAHGQPNPDTRQNHVSKAIRYLNTIKGSDRTPVLVCEIEKLTQWSMKDFAIEGLQNFLLGVLIDESRQTGQKCAKSLPRTSAVYEQGQQVWFNDTPHRVIHEAEHHYILRPLFPFDSEPDIVLPKLEEAP